MCFPNVYHRVLGGQTLKKKWRKYTTDEVQNDGRQTPHFKVSSSFSLAVRVGTASGKNIFRNKTKTHNFSAHKYDGYDLQ